MHRFLLALALALIMNVQHTAAQRGELYIASGTVSSLFVDETSFEVVVVGLVIRNPAHCPQVDSYRSQRELYYATALTAFTMSKLLTLTIDPSQCVNGRPKIVGMYLGSDETDLAGRINTIANHLDTIEQRVNDLNNQIAQRADQALAQGNQIASKMDRVEQELVGLARMTSHDPEGRTLITMVGMIAQKLGAIP